MKAYTSCRLAVCTAVLLPLLLSACSWSDPGRVESDFGNSVRHMLEQQKAAAPQPVKDVAQPRLDGESAVNSLDSYRTSQKKSTTRKSLDTLAPLR